MNFDNINKLSDHFRNTVAPHLHHRIMAADFANYMAKMSQQKSCQWLQTEMRAFPVFYLIDPVKFMERYSDKCVSFNPTPQPQDGLIHIIYQISPTLHVLARLYQSLENDKVLAYLSLTAAYRDVKEFLKFYDANLDIRLAGNTDEKPAGFGAHLNGHSVNPLLGRLVEERD